MDAPEGRYHNWDNWRYDLISKITQVFDYEPTLGASCIRFGIATDEPTGKPQMEGSSSVDWIGNSDWTQAGTKVEY